MTTKIHKSHLALLKLIEKDGNNFCADCGVSGTRWASWNLGIFLCIRCAGIHRNLGVHISKVKSVDLDSWTTEQMGSMEMMGNKKSQNIFEAALPEFFMRPQTNYAIEEFIRAKYQHKRYCISKETEESTECSKEKIKHDDFQKDLVNFQVAEADPVIEGSDDSLSDPDYIVQQKQPSKSCHKVYSEGDLISFNPNSNALNSKELQNTNNKNTILSLYNNPSVNQGYQSSGHDTGSCHHRSYGSSTDSAYYSTTNIPVDSQSTYLRQIQEKLSNFKVNLTAKFRQYEQPPNNPSFTSNGSSNSGVSQKHQVNQDIGQTLSPDLWK